MGSEPNYVLVTEAERAELLELRRKVANYENAITWDVTCFRCAAHLDAAYEETVRRERAEATIAEVLATCDLFERTFGQVTSVPTSNLRAILAG